jgi:hypothetical protein
MYERVCFAFLFVCLQSVVVGGVVIVVFLEWKYMYVMVVT